MSTSKTYFVVGGSSVSGQAIIKGLSATGTRIVSTTSGTGEVQGTDRTIPGIDLASTDAAEKMIAGMRSEAGTLSGIIYVPARGEVGIPAAAATQEMVDESINYSIRPMLELMRALKPELTICISGFITMEPMLQIYGAMTYTKLIMEDLAVRHPERFKVLRVGMFQSKSVRGIALLVQRNATRGLYPELKEMASLWRESGVKKFPDWMWTRNWEYEDKIYRESAASDKPFRPTEPEDIQRTITRITDGEPAPIVNLLGDWVWTETGMPDIPEIVRKNENLLQTDLDQYFQS